MYNNNAPAEHNFFEPHLFDEIDIGTMEKMDKKSREKICAKRKMAARRAIETHYENKRLEKALSDFDYLA